jgi:repressor LexA
MADGNESNLNGGTVGEAIRARRTHLGWSLQKLADHVGCAKSYISEVETGRRALPSDDVLAKIEAFMMLAPGSLVDRAAWERGVRAGGPSVERGIDQLQQQSEAGRKLAALLREHMGKGKNALDELYRAGRLHGLIGELSPAEASATEASRRAGNIAKLPRKVPVEVPLINAVSAGYPREFTDLSYPARVADEYVKCPDIDDPDAFAARVVGDSMMPDYRQGDVIVFSPVKPVKNGSDCFVRLERDAETTFKRVYFEKSEQGEELIRLQPINNAYSPKVFPREDIAGLYVAVKAIREI